MLQHQPDTTKHMKKKNMLQPTGHHEKPQAHVEKTGLVDIGEGFFLKNIKFEPFGSSSQISGEIMNKSEQGPWHD